MEQSSLKPVSCGQVTVAEVGASEAEEVVVEWEAETEEIEGEEGSEVEVEEGVVFLVQLLALPPTWNLWE